MSLELELPERWQRESWQRKKESVSLSWNADRISGEIVTMRKMPMAF